MAETTPSPPGTRLFAPQVRLVDPDDPERFAVDSPADRDLISARVTQVNHGVSQVSLTLNNQRHDGGRPVHPPWKYNGLDTLRFGQQVRVDFRYGEDRWTPMILARVTDIKFGFPASGGSTVMVQGEDLLSLFKIKGAEDRRYDRKHELEIAAEVLRVVRERAEAPQRRLLLGASVAGSLVPRPTFTEPLRTMTYQKSKTYLQFLQELGEPLDYEVFVDFDDPTSESSPVSLHFEPARSLVAPPPAESPPQPAAPRPTVVDLGRGVNLVEFTPEFKVWEQFTSATARGRDPRRREVIAESVAAEAISDDLHAEEGQPRPIHAIDARQRFFSGDHADADDNPEPVDVSNLDATRARLRAARALRERAREFLTAEAQTIGFPQLRPGIHVSLSGFYAPFDGLYYVTKAVHTIDGGGYKTQISLRRPGMLPPEDYPGRGGST